MSENLSLTQIVEADYDYIKNVVQPKFWYIPKDKYWRFKTNALNVMLNEYKVECLDSLKSACHDEEKEVRKMAKWVLLQLKSTLTFD